ncbi:hypothetical protein OIU34_23750 [Pararhizobium sp. BT-229]|uniref:hypothetical protein n=1 Tax=Pararhizobium sp. BT-229 TaxID=2986923 RepID=UPI0021F734CA|nr:hypothetical protein [Pararhizobium sp. BT-229]MCV9964912.1 hypothetical protein [Pararhizobium sp. BT-229]
MSVIVPGPNIDVRKSVGRLAPFLLSIGAGVATSPAFTFGSLMTTRKSVALAGVLTLAWAILLWRFLWADYFWNPDIGEMAKAIDGRVHDPAASYVFAAAFVQTACCLAAGRIARWLYDHHRQSVAPLALASVAFALVLFGQWNSSSSEVEYARSQGGESGRIEVIAQSWKVANAIITDLAQTDREKLLVGYAQRLTVKRGAGVEGRTLRLDEYIAGLAAACADNNGKDAICANKTLDEIRSSKKLLNFSR